MDAGNQNFSQGVTPMVTSLGHLMGACKYHTTHQYGGIAARMMNLYIGQGDSLKNQVGGTYSSQANYRWVLSYSGSMKSKKMVYPSPKSAAEPTGLYTGARGYRPNSRRRTATTTPCTTPKPKNVMRKTLFKYCMRGGAVDQRMWAQDRGQQCILLLYVPQGR